MPQHLHAAVTIIGLTIIGLLGLAIWMHRSNRKAEREHRFNRRHDY